MKTLLVSFWGGNHDNRRYYRGYIQVSRRDFSYGKVLYLTCKKYKDIPDINVNSYIDLSHPKVAIKTNFPTDPIVLK